MNSIYTYNFYYEYVYEHVILHVYTTVIVVYIYKPSPWSLR